MTTKSILVADNQPAIRTLLEEYLNINGYNVIAAKDGAHAISLLDKKPDLAILDIRMPKYSGLQVLEKIRSNKQSEKMPVLIITAYDREEEEEWSNTLGADGYFIKPIDLKKLVKKIRTLI